MRISAFLAAFAAAAMAAMPASAQPLGIGTSPQEAMVAALGAIADFQDKGIKQVD